MTKLKRTLLLLTILIGVSAYSQTKEDAFSDAEITAKATLEMEFETVIKHTLPAVVDLMGGKDAAINMIKGMFDSMKTQGFVFEKADVVSVSDVVEEQGQYRCVVENFNQMKMADQRIKSKSYLLGIYNDTDNYWWFIEAKQLKNQMMIDQVLPDFETSLDIPEDDMQTEAIDD
ncbi:hypothetical protein [Winogradskyella flava]|uniref:Uncharacterized protein n=1 Tax=Winogradskyella flava TaxID=1884876 RepID=A0A842ISP7_9FLAO|nr:hypothetical protein [Winogradskyella flava]MBC2843888.1 hypothetical protein [Winogradskyella flava]